MTALLFTGTRLTPAVLAFSMLTFGFGVSVPVAGEPVVHGYGLDLETFFDVTPEDCLSCSEQELTELGQGLQFLLARFREETVNPFGDVCVAEAALSRELAVLTYDLVRNRTVTARRWRQFLRARAQISGGLSEITKEEMLAAFLERVGDRSGTDISPGSVDGEALRIYGAAQLSRIFEQMRVGEWGREKWAGALSSTSGGFHEVIDPLLATSGPSRALLDAALLDSRPQDAWIEGELPHLASLPPDFEVGDIPGRSDAILGAYDQAVRSHRWATFYFYDGTCGVEAQFGWREKAIELAENFPWLPMGPGAEKDDCDGEDAPAPCWSFGDEVDVVGTGIPLGPYDPNHNALGPFGPWTPGPGGPGVGPPGPLPHETACEDWIRSISDATAVCSNPPNDACRPLTSTETTALAQNCNPPLELCVDGGRGGPCIPQDLCNNLAETCRYVEVEMPDMGVNILQTIQRYIIDPCQAIRFACRMAHDQP